MKTKPTYYSLLTRTDGVWSMEFGDYDRETVEFELLDKRDHGARKADLKIVTTDANEAAILAVVSTLNVGA